MRQVLASTKSTDPLEIIEQVMAHPSIPIYGPEHHVIVPAAIITAGKNTSYPAPKEAIEKAIERASKVPGRVVRIIRRLRCGRGSWYCGECADKRHTAYG